MKNHIVFKFIAIILCAATLMGAVGSITGIVVLTAGDLYNKTVDQMLEEQMDSDSYDFSFWVARNYASTELGGCSDALVNTRYGSHWLSSRYDSDHYGYAVFDAQGNELLSYNTEIKEGAALYSNTITGQYMHLVSEESASQIQAREAAERIASYGADFAVDSEGNTIPAEGIAVNQVFFTDADGSLIYEAYCNAYDGHGSSIYHYYDTGYYANSYDHESNRAGFLFYNQAGQVVYNSFLEEYEAGFAATVYGLLFANETNGFTFQLDNPEGLGTLSAENGSLIFVSYPVATAAEETEPVTEPTIAPTIAEETVPETISEVTIPEESIAETQPEILLDEEGNPIESTEPAAAEENAPEETVPAEITDEAAEASADGETIEETTDSEEAAEPQTTEVMEVSEDAAAPAETGAEETISEGTVPAETIAEETISVETAPVETVPAETIPEVTEPVLIQGKPLDNYQINHADYYDSSLQEHVTAQFVYVPMPELTVELYFAEGALRYEAGYDALRMVRQVRNYLLPTIGICLLIFAIFTVYLCTAAGRKPKSEEIRAGGLNRIPLDLYLFGGGFLIACIAALGVGLANELLRRDFMVGCSFAAGALFLSCLIFVGFCFAFVSQIKTPGGFWWRNTLCGHCLRLCIRLAVWLKLVLVTKVFPWLGKVLKWFWQFTLKVLVWLFKTCEKLLLRTGNVLGRFFRWLGRVLHRFLSLLPITWQWLLAGLVMILSTFLVTSYSAFFVLLGILIPIAIILYAAHCFGILSESTKRMSKGDLDTKVDDKMMTGCFKNFADDLNNLADVAVVAAQKQLKSERMKTELITNVSHDIKTPLTSIINYVDLLQKPHTEEEGEQYLEVLDRQSQRLKKLIDDLMDMSKANTGNMTVEITTVDAVESVNQALGEFADKLDKAQLIPVFRHTEERMPMLADGRLVWRVLSNLLSNAVKYAMPGTRLYIDLVSLEGKVFISLKNISREELNVDADELMERFVRGDDSRNTEGSGLGLNIAKSLMDLQKGQLQLLVDGDLFKVTLIFPEA